MLEIFQYSFMIRAFIAGSIAAITIPLLGSYLVARRYSLIADSLAHVSLAGVGLGLIVGVSPIVAAVPIAIAGAVGLEYLRQQQRLSGEISLAMLMSGGLALAVVLASQAGSRVDFNSYLFGSITTVTTTDIIILAGVAIGVFGFVGRYFKDLLFIAFDEDGAWVRGVAVKRLNYLLAILTAVLVVICLRIIGGLLIGALLVMPVIAASRLVTSFKRVMVVAVLVALLSCWLGLTVSYYGGLPAGGAIVLANLAMVVLSILASRADS